MRLIALPIALALALTTAACEDPPDRPVTGNMSVEICKMQVERQELPYITRLLSDVDICRPGTPAIITGASDLAAIAIHNYCDQDKQITVIPEGDQIRVTCTLGNQNMMNEIVYDHYRQWVVDSYFDDADPDATEQEGKAHSEAGAE